MPEHLKLMGIKVGNILISNEMLESDEFGVCFENSNPSLVSLVGTILNNLKGDDKPHLISVNKNGDIK